MAQKLFTKKFGEIEVEQSWVDGANHIALLTNGAYCHITGLPIRSKSELQAVLTGENLERALHWFDHRHDDDEKPPRRIMFEPDGTPVFEDGAPVESVSDLVQSLQPGPVLDGAIKALVLKQEGKQAKPPKTEMAPQKAASKKKKKAGPNKKSAPAVRQKATPMAPAAQKEPAQITV